VNALMAKHPGHVVTLSITALQQRQFAVARNNSVPE
jgi:hypothetical protein